ncbi:response regulator [Plastoroseomonas arctica]|uniref:Response regulator n=1 Tax=Plastoroseomonas arctica TaxID=1509237 RepID=A0AAF1KM07_9PROT|nr:response regulator [Plastoroseomonas arctica]MBR0655511.1 response regulator [Plastoroseomonas arctica]
MKVLVVEDDDGIAELVDIALRNAGHKVLGPAVSYDEAMAIAEREKPDMGLLNINLVGLGTGIDLARELHARSIPSVFISGNTHDEGAREFAVGSLAKPYRLASLIGAVELVRCLIAGVDPPTLPTGFVLFRRGRFVRAGIRVAV